jgi:mxaA protein
MTAATRGVAGLALAWCAVGPAARIAEAAAAPPQVSAAVRAPRAFGYVVGDVVRESVYIAVPPGLSLDPSTLPRRGRIDAWLEVRAVSVAQEDDAAVRRYDVELDYQIVNAPRELRTIALPGLSLAFAGPTGKIRETVGDQPINVAPLTTELLRVGLEEMRPDVAPEPLPERAPRLRLLREGGAAVLCALLFAAARRGRRRGGPGRPFARARSILAGLPRDAQVDAETYRRALRAVHRAFDAEAGRTLFPEDLRGFLDGRGVTGELRAFTERFYAGSRAAFFAPDTTSPPAGPSIAELVALCEAWGRAPVRR